MIESAVSSNRIEGSLLIRHALETIIFGRPSLRDRDEEEVRGYRDALKLIHEQGAKLHVSEETILNLHRLCRGEIWDAGKYKEKDGDIIEKYANGRERVRFKTVPAAKTPSFTKKLIEMWQQCLEERWVHPLIAMAAFNLDFLCVHPFRDGNGRVSRLLLLLQCYHLGYEVGRYISLERLIEQNKDRYYETLVGMETDACHAYCCCSNVIISGLKLDVTSALNVSLNKTKNVTMRHWSRTPRDGMKENMIPGHM